MLVRPVLRWGRDVTRISLSPIVLLPGIGRSFGSQHVEEVRVSKIRGDQFLVGEENGFLPQSHPLVTLPEKYGVLNKLLEQMPVTLPDGSSGLLDQGIFGDTVIKELPDYTEDIEKETDGRVLTALFRDYAFLTSAYLLEPCDHEQRRSGNYGLGRQVLPRKIAVPFSNLAERLGTRPFLEYAFSYALANYTFKDPNAEDLLAHDNLKTVRGFDGSDAESGFILVHVAMVTHSGKLVRAMRRALAGLSWDDREEFNAGMRDMREVCNVITRTLEQMWKRSDAKSFARFRTYIMGTYNQPMFPDGVVYEGVSTEGVQYRGASGAMDSLVPAIDNMLQVTSLLPSNPLTEVLMDFRKCRPEGHSLFLNELTRRSEERGGVLHYARQDPTSLVCYLQNLDVIREFRMSHWNLTREYVLKYTDHPVATGGSPILSWLPNQLMAVLQLSVDISKEVDVTKLDPATKESFLKLQKMTAAQDRLLKRELTMIQEKAEKAALAAKADYTSASK